MFRLEATTHLPHAPAAVYATVAGVESALHWQVGVIGVRRARGRLARPAPSAAPAPDAFLLTHPTIAPLERRRDVLLLGYYALGVRYTLVTHITAAVPGARFAYRAEGTAFALDVTLDFEAARGGTAVSYQLALTTHPPLVDAGDADALRAHEQRAAAFRRLLVRRAPRDLSRLEQHVARMRRGRGLTPPDGLSTTTLLSGPGPETQNGSTGAPVVPPPVA